MLVPMGWGRALPGVLASCLLPLAVFFIGLASNAAAAECPNEAIRDEQGSTYLPGCMALEMATPAQKAGSPVLNPSFSANGDRVLFRSSARLGDSTSYVAPLGDLYVAARGPDGWTTAATTAPGAFGFGELSSDEAAAFTSDFGRWVSFESTQAQFTKGEVTLYEGVLEGPWSARSPLIELFDRPNVVPIDETQAEAEREKYTTKIVTGASADLSHVVFRGATQVAYLPDDPQPSTEYGNTYLLDSEPTGGPVLELLGRDASGEVWGGNCATWLGGGNTSANSNGRDQGAISAGGSRIFFSTRPGQPWDQATHTGPACEPTNPVRIMVREETPAGPQIEELLPSSPVAGSDFFDGASEDQSRVYFTSSRVLAATDLDTGAEECSATVGASKGCDLYLYETTPGGHRIVQVSAGGVGDPTPGEGANVLKGVTAISGDGSHAYFVAQGVLTTDPNPEGAIAEPGKPNLYAYNVGTATTSFIGTLSQADSRILYGAEMSHQGGAVAVPMRGEAGGQEIGGDGHVLIFQSAAALTADDTDGGHVDIYRYDADAVPPTSECVSCRPGGLDAEPFDVVPRVNSRSRVLGPEFAEWERWASEDGQGVVFATKEALLPDDTDGELSDYLWQAGRLTLLPGSGKQPAISQAGNEVAFETAEPLLPSDGDTAPDIYVARENGGYPAPPRTAPCSGEACQGPAGALLAQTAPASGSLEGSGNIKRPASCPKSKVRKKGRCVKRAHAKKHQKHNKGKGKHRGHKQAGHKQGGRK